ncbi:quinic acid utilization activator [Pyrenophora tritici-repentis]|nr:quinic acid utilization activator [Pyrenophora tritici-repentis]KAI1572096.1 quinic acid utilization activator [Pyrenophora tritici-repentis]PWO24100.1 CORD and CS domain containing protein [Pyrenophora tritici-repentis]
MLAQSQAKRRSAPQPEEKPAKRTRISRACDQCRLAREKCDGVQPACSTCSGASRQCSYTANPKKRGIQPGYIRTLELALAWLFQQNAENEVALNEKLAKEGASSLLLSRDSKESNKLHRRWRKAKFYTNVDKQLSGGETSRHEQPDDLSHSSDEGSDAEEAPVANGGHRRERSEHAPAVTVSPGLQHPSTAPQVHTTRPSALMPTDSYKLFEVYFTHIQSWLPICEKHDVLKSAYSYPLQGLLAISEQPDSGSYAELWSILAIASLYDTSTNSESSLNTPSAMAVKSYENAKSIIPSELGHFEAGHITALLNLAVFNMAQSQTGAAWLLIGCASRALKIMDQPSLLTNPRHKHIHYGCFLLENMIALQLDQRPYVRKAELNYLGAIDENGLEEWQPWSGFGDPSPDGRRTPLLALSTFNSILELIDILSSIQKPDTTSQKDTVRERLERWKAFLPTQLACVDIESPLPCLTPPLALLQATYHVACFATNPSDLRLKRLFDILEQCRQQLGPQRIPPPIKCLLEYIRRQAAYSGLNDANRTRLQKLREKIMAQWPKQQIPNTTQTHESTFIPFRDQRNALKTANPDPLRSIFPDNSSVAQLPADTHNVFFTDTHSTIEPLLIAASTSQSDTLYPEPIHDLESFFDELASLDRVTRPDNQPQFMQNLGFGPEASMADLFSEYIPMQSSSFATSDVTPPVQFDQYGFYNGG